MGKGRTRWRDTADKIVGQDEASGGLAIAQQWELLCPGPANATAKAPTRALAPTPAPEPAPAKSNAAKTPAIAPPSAAPSISGAQFAAGDVVEAKYSAEWVRGTVTRVIESAGSNGPRIEV